MISPKIVPSISTATRAILIPVLLISVLSVAVAASTVTVKPGASIQAAVNNNPAGTTFLISAGVYRQQSIVPKNGDSFIGSGAAILNGSTLLGGFTLSNKLWISHLAVSAPKSLPGLCFTWAPMCLYPEDLYFDGKLFSRVASLSGIASTKWFLDYNTGTVYIADNPTGHTVEVTTTKVAFSGSASDVTIKGLIIEKYGNLAQSGAILAQAPSGSPGNYWVVENNEICYNHGPGITGNLGMKILSNNIHHNGQIGISTSGDNLLVEANEIAYNNTDEYDYFWEGGGAKFSYTHNLVVSHNYVHDNYGAGLHTDIDNYNTLYEYNYTSHNQVSGIFHEVSFNAIIRYNTVVHEGYNAFGKTGPSWGAGILNQSSPDVEVYGNTVKGCTNGIAAVQYKRTDPAWLVQNFYVHDNSVTQGIGVAAGIGDLVGNTAIYTSRNNRFKNNTYSLPSGTPKSFLWMEQNITKPTWNSYNQD